jgi:fructose-1,6-bisphosphatase II
VLSVGEMVAGDDILFAATGITDGILLSGVKYHGDEAQTESMALRCATGTRRIIQSLHSTG